MSSLRGLYDKTKKMKTFQIFQSLPQENLWDIAGNLVQENLKKDAIVLRPFIKNQTTYLIIKGEIQVQNQEQASPSVSKTSLKTLNTMCGPIKIKSYQNIPNRSILRQGDSFGFDLNITRGVYKPYVPQCFAKCKSNCILYTIKTKLIAEVFANLQSITLDKLLELRPKFPLLSIDGLGNCQNSIQKRVSFYRPPQKHQQNTPISRQQTESTFNYPRNKSCLQNYDGKSESKSKPHFRTASRDHMEQNVSYFIHNLIVKKIRKQNQRHNEKQQQFRKILKKRKL